MTLNTDTQTNLADECLDSGRFVAQASDGFAQFILEFLQVMTAQVLHLNVLEIVPYPFIGVEFRGITRQLRQIQLFRATLAQKVLDRAAAVSGQAIPDDQQLATDVTREVLQKLHDGLAIKRLLPRHGVQFAFRRNRADHRQMLPVRVVQHRRLPTRSVGANRCRQQGKPRFIYEDQGSLFLDSLFCSSKSQAWD